MTNNLLYFQRNNRRIFESVICRILDNSLELALPRYYILRLYYTKTVTGARNDSTTYAKLIVNSTEILHVIAETTGEFDDDQGANIAVVQCNKGDDVWVAGDGTLRGDTEGNSDTRTSSFSGFLLHQTSD